MFLLATLMLAFAAAPRPATVARDPAARTDVAALISAVELQAKALGNSAGLQRGFAAFISEYQIPSGGVRYSDYVTARLLYESTRDAGLWGLHWSITNKPPNSDAIWAQWSAARNPSFNRQTATAECDELSALYAFLAERAGVRAVGLFWPYPNHTVAVWSLRPATNSFVRVVIPTSQIFLSETDDFGTRAFNPWTQKTIYEYKRHDVADSFELPRPLFEFFVAEMAKYGGASDAALQKLRYLRDAVFQGSLPAEAAAQEAIRLRAVNSNASSEDLSAFDHFADDMRRAADPKSYSSR